MLPKYLGKIFYSLLGVVLLGNLQPAMAAGTVAGTTISNAATVNYLVGGFSQPAIVSNTVSFVVDRKINLTAATLDVTAVSVAPGSSGNVLKFTVTNNGNDTQDFQLSGIAVATLADAKFGGLKDAVDATSVVAYADVNGNGTYEAITDTVTYIDELAPDTIKTVFLVATFPTGQANGSIASYHLLAEARVGGAAAVLGAALTQTGVDTPGSVDIVFADVQGSATASDALRDAKHSSQSDYVINGANLSIAKTSAVISDPFNAGVNPKAIPDAVVEYTITVTNAADGASATSITISDSLNAEIVGTRLAFNADTYAVGKGIRVTAPNINGGAALDLTNVNGDDVGDWNVSGANTVTVSGISLNATQSATIKFRVTIQ